MDTNKKIEIRKRAQSLYYMLRERGVEHSVALLVVIEFVISLCIEEE